MTIIIQQYFGIGDIIWGQTIANDYLNLGYKVLWPVKPEWVEGLRRAYPRIEFVDYTMIPVDYENKNLYEKDGFTYLPMRFSESLMGRPYKFHMESKYSFLKKDWRRWKSHAMPERSELRENMLRDQIAPFAHDGSKYNFVSRSFGTSMEIFIPPINNGLPTVELTYVPGYSLFDWCWIIENATEIHAVSSSTLYLFELLNLKANGIHLYLRQPIESNFEYVEFLFSKPYKLHQ